MRVLFVTVAPIGSVAAGGIYTDLLREFRDGGHEVHVLSPAEGAYGLLPGRRVEDGVDVIRVSTGSVTRSKNLLVKGLSTLAMETQFIRAMKQHFEAVLFDLVLYTSPPVNIDRLLRWIQRRSHAKTYLMLKDIFPQNAVDIGLMRAGGPAWRYFRHRERALYRISDFIGCMSEANAAYVLRENPEVDPARVEVCPNAITPVPFPVDIGSRAGVRASLGVPEDALLLVYGGNLGRPQGITFLLEVIDSYRERNDVYFLIIGSGTEYSSVQAHLANTGNRRARLLPSMPREEFTRALAASDVGLIFLDARFTIPNFPSRLTAYLEAGVPVIAATDVASDVSAVLEAADCGIGVPAGDVEAFEAAVERFLANPELIGPMGMRGRQLLEAEYTSARCYEIITAHLVTAPEANRCIDVRDMDGRDVAEVVRLHLDAMPEFFLTSLGRRFLRRYYSHLLEAPSSVAKVAVNADDAPVGFVVGSTDPAGFYGRLLRQHWWSFALAALPAAARRPLVIRRLLRAMRYPGTQPKGQSVAGLYSIAVHPDMHGQGIGRLLVTEFLAASRVRESQSVYLHADAVGNDHWNDLLQRMGWRLDHTFTTPEGRPMNEYWIDTLQGEA